MDAVIKVFATHTEPNWSLPWQRKRQVASTSSGFIIDGHRLLTNAHSVEHSTQVKVKHRGSEAKYVAKVCAIGTECDLALLTVDDPAFWAGVTPVVLGKLPRLQDSVTVVGFPIGGDTISVTAGVVSRIEMTPYSHSSCDLLGVQIDAAINAGNSGGPCFDDQGACIGVAFQSLKDGDADGIGYIVPVPVVQHFLNDVAVNGKYTGFPVLGIEWQKLESPSLRRALGLGPSQKGVLVRRMEPTSSVAKHLKRGDVLLSFDDNDIASDGTVPFRTGERVVFAHLVSKKLVGAPAKLRVWSDRHEKTCSVTLSAPRRLVPTHTAGMPPQFYIHAGLVFTPVTTPYLRAEYGKEYDYEAPVKLLDKLLHGQAERDDEQVVVLSQVLAADVNIGYEDIVNTSVVGVNGTAVRNLRHLVELVEGCKSEFLRLDLDYGQLIALDTKQSRAATAAILETHNIARKCSADLDSALADKGLAAAGVAAVGAAVDDAAASPEAGAGGDSLTVPERTPRRKR